MDQSSSNFDDDFLEYWFFIAPLFPGLTGFEEFSQDKTVWYRTYETGRDMISFEGNWDGTRSIPLQTLLISGTVSQEDNYTPGLTVVNFARSRSCRAAQILDVTGATISAEGAAARSGTGGAPGWATVLAVVRLDARYSIAARTCGQWMAKEERD